MQNKVIDSSTSDLTEFLLLFRFEASQEVQFYVKNVYKLGEKHATSISFKVEFPLQKYPSASAARYKKSVLIMGSLLLLMVVMLAKVLY